MGDLNYVDRSPRLQPPRPQEIIQIPPPPKREQSMRTPIWQRLLPLVTVGAYFAIALTGMGRNPLYMIPMGFSALVSVVAGLYLEHKARETLGQAEQEYAQQLVTMRKELEDYHAQQRQFFLHNHPDIETVLNINGRDHASPSGTRLWERRRYDVDFGHLRLGIGTMPSDVVYVLKDQVEGSQVSREAQKLADDSRYVDNIAVPLAIHVQEVDEEVESLVDRPVHAIGICPGKGDLRNVQERLYGLVYSLIIQYAAFHSPLDAQLCLASTHRASRRWMHNGRVWLIDLPHCVIQKNISETIFPVCLENPGEAADNIRRKQDPVSKFWHVVYEELEQRKQRLSDTDDQSQTDYRFPLLLVIVDLMTPLSPDGSEQDWLNASAFQNITSQPAVSLILHEGHRLGASIIFLTPARSKIPDGCSIVLEVDHNGTVSSNSSAFFRLAETGVNMRRYVGQADHLQISSRVEQYISTLAGWRIAQGQDGIPDSVTLLEIEAEGDPAQTKYIEQLHIENRWEKSLDKNRADWLKANIGMMAGGEIRTLHFFTDADGVHALVAGSTGSGKSELLLALVLSMSINYDPTIVNFVLVDFKGGTAFDPLKELPHVVDVVTNLNEAAVDRMFTAIDAELHRRERINKDRDVKHIVNYREKNYHRQYLDEPYPHLFIIIDEFAEMLTGDKKDEYRARLNSITRLGRALGVTLILAAQRPSGVSDQMRANIKCRICLRVEDKEGSTELLGRPDAAYLPSIAGRGYVQVGNAGVLQQVQMAFTGANYQTETSDDKRPIVWTKLEENIPRFHNVLAGSIKQSFDQLVRIGARDPREQPRKPWPDPLPTQLALNIALDTAPDEPSISRDYSFYLKDDTDSVALDCLSYYRDRIDPDAPQVLNPELREWEEGRRTNWSANSDEWWGQFAMKAVIGIIDDPINIRIKPLFVDFPKHRHTVLFSSSGWGKSTFLESVLLSLVATHSPSEFHVYTLDFGSQSLRSYRNLPHMGAYITRDETERIYRLFRVLDQMVAERKQQGVIGGLYAHNAHHGTEFPAVLVIIDNFSEFHEHYWDELESSFMTLIGQSASVGIHFLITTDQVSSITSKLLAQFGQRLALKLNNLDDYSTIVNSRVRIVEDIPGRGLVQDQRYPVSFQVATLNNTQTIDHAEKAIQHIQARDRVIKAMKTVFDTEQGYDEPRRIDILDQFIELKTALEDHRSDPSSRHMHTPLGKSDTTLRNLDLSFDRRPHMLISGETQTGKTTTLWTILLGLVHNYYPDDLQFILVDTRRMLFDYGGETRFDRLPHVRHTFSEPEDGPVFIETLETLYTKGGKPDFDLVVLIDNYDDFKDDLFDKKSEAALNTLARLARNHFNDGLHFVLAGEATGLRGDKFTRQVGSSRYGIGLSVQAADNSPLSGGLSLAQKNAELFPGRGFVVHAGKATMLQLAAPYSQSGDFDQDLDAMIATECMRYGIVDPWREPDVPVVKDAVMPEQEANVWDEYYSQIGDLPDDAFEHFDQELRSKLSLWRSAMPADIWKKLDNGVSTRELNRQEWEHLVESIMRSQGLTSNAASILGEGIGRIRFGADYDALIVPDEPVDEAPELSFEEEWQIRFDKIQALERKILEYSEEYAELMESTLPAELYMKLRRGNSIVTLSIEDWQTFVEILRENFTKKDQILILGRPLARILLG